MRYPFVAFGISVLGCFGLIISPAIAQSTNNITVPNNSESTANPVSNLDQQGSLVNTQINTNQLGRSVVGKGIADCTSSGLSASAFGSGIGPFDTGSIGGAITYTHSFGMETCKQYAKTQLGRAKLETCLLLISNYSKMVKAGVDISYQELMSITDLECPEVKIRTAVVEPKPAPRLQRTPPPQPPAITPQAPVAPEPAEPVPQMGSRQESEGQAQAFVEYDEQNPFLQPLNRNAAALVDDPQQF